MFEDGEHNPSKGGGRIKSFDRGGDQSALHGKKNYFMAGNDILSQETRKGLFRRRGDTGSSIWRKGNHHSILSRKRKLIAAVPNLQRKGRASY